MIPAIHNPQTVATPSERLFAERYRQSRERMQRAGKIHSEKPVKQSCTRDFNPSSAVPAEVIVVYEPEPIEQWRDRQMQNHPPLKRPWFSIVEDLGPVGPQAPLIEEIQIAVADYFGITHFDMLSARRTNRIIIPRQVAYYLCKQLTIRTYPEIGRRFGGRDHTSILSGVRKITRLRASDAGLSRDIDAIVTLLGGAIA